jgi:hypothetical protein
MKAFVNTVLKVSCLDPARERKASDETQTIKATLRRFYDEHYKEYVHEPVSYTHLNTAIDYMAEKIITMYENNIKQHFIEYVERFVNVVWDKKGMIEILKTEPNSEREIRANCVELRKVKMDLMRPGQPL